MINNVQKQMFFACDYAKTPQKESKNIIFLVFVNSATPIRLSLQKDYSLDTLIIFFKASFRFESIVVMNKG